MDLARLLQYLNDRQNEYNAAQDDYYYGEGHECSGYKNALDNAEQELEDYLKNLIREVIAEEVE